MFKIIEEMYKPKNGWILNTILQESGNCHLYEKIGYRKTGEIGKIINQNNKVRQYVA